MEYYKKQKKRKKFRLKRNEQFIKNIFLPRRGLTWQTKRKGKKKLKYEKMRNLYQIKNIIGITVIIISLLKPKIVSSNYPSRKLILFKKKK